MTTTNATLLTVAITVVVLVALCRRALARHGSGRLAQVAFQREHGRAVAKAMDGAVDPRAGSPWIVVRLDGRDARLVAAPLRTGGLQAGVQLFDWSIPVQVWHTTGEPSELDVPAGVDVAAVLEVVGRLRALGVDSLAAPALEQGIPHVLRVRFETPAELPVRLEAVAPLLRELEALAPTPG
ncbi:MAG: hypothetical protein JWM98_1736 [Thermoleophilia bacterium]|nr:hypothetical protein [Thermoleophilia bacterium]